MCLAVPTKVVLLNGHHAEIELGGITRKVSTVLTPEVRVGDYVLIHAGFAIAVIDEQEAEETIKLLNQLDFD